MNTGEELMAKELPEFRSDFTFEQCKAFIDNVMSTLQRLEELQDLEGVYSTVKELSRVHSLVNKQEERNEIAQYLIDAGFPKLAVQFIKRLNNLGVFSCDGTWFSTFYFYSIAWNYSDTYAPFATALGVSGISHLLNLNIGHQPYLDNVKRKNVYFLVKASLCILHNICRIPGNRDMAQYDIGRDALLNIMQLKDEESLRCLATLCLGYLTKECDLDITLTKQNNFDGLLQTLLNQLHSAGTSTRRKYHGFSVNTYLSALVSFVLHDRIKLMLLDSALRTAEKHATVQTVNPPVKCLHYLEMLVGNLRLPLVGNIANLEAAKGIQIIYHMLFHPQLRIDERVTTCLRALTDMLDSPGIRERDNKAIERVVKQMVWQVVQPHRSSLYMLHALPQANKLGPVLLSYPPISRPAVNYFITCLNQAGVPMINNDKRFIDDENAQAVGLSGLAASTESMEEWYTCLNRGHVMLAFLSDAYRISPGCRTELEYFLNNNTEASPKIVLYLVLPPKFKPNGWLMELPSLHEAMDFTHKKNFPHVFQQFMVRICKLYSIEHVRYEIKEPIPPNDTTDGQKGYISIEDLKALSSTSPFFTSSDSDPSQQPKATLASDDLTNAGSPRLQNDPSAIGQYKSSSSSTLAPFHTNPSETEPLGSMVLSIPKQGVHHDGQIDKYKKPLNGGPDGVTLPQSKLLNSQYSSYLLYDSQLEDTSDTKRPPIARDTSKVVPTTRTDSKDNRKTGSTRSPDQDSCQRPFTRVISKDKFLSDKENNKIDQMEKDGNSNKREPATIEYINENEKHQINDEQVAKSQPEIHQTIQQQLQQETPKPNQPIRPNTPDQNSVDAQPRQDQIINPISHPSNKAEDISHASNVSGKTTPTQFHETQPQTETRNGTTTELVRRRGNGHVDKSNASMKSTEKDLTKSETVQVQSIPAETPVANRNVDSRKSESRPNTPSQHSVDAHSKHDQDRVNSASNHSSKAINPANDIKLNEGKTSPALSQQHATELPVECVCEPRESREGKTEPLQDRSHGKDASITLVERAQNELLSSNDTATAQNATTEIPASNYQVDISKTDIKSIHSSSPDQNSINAHYKRDQKPVNPSSPPGGKINDPVGSIKTTEIKTSPASLVHTTQPTVEAPGETRATISREGKTEPLEDRSHSKYTTSLVGLSQKEKLEAIQLENVQNETTNTTVLNDQDIVYNRNTTPNKIFVGEHDRDGRNPSSHPISKENEPSGNIKITEGNTSPTSPTSSLHVTEPRTDFTQEHMILSNTIPQMIPLSETENKRDEVNENEVNPQHAGSERIDDKDETYTTVSQHTNRSMEATDNVMNNDRGSSLAERLIQTPDLDNSEAQNKTETKFTKKVNLLGGKSKNRKGSLAGWVPKSSPRSKLQVNTKPRDNPNSPSSAENDELPASQQKSPPIHVPLKDSKPNIPADHDSQLVKTEPAKTPIFNKWNNTDVIAWLKANDLDHLADHLDIKFDGELLLQLLSMRHWAPEYYAQSLRSELGLSFVDGLRLTSALEKLESETGWLPHRCTHLS